jgi:hypothetical protein
MVTRSFIACYISAIVFALAACSDRRPKAADASADFTRLYPAAEVVSVRMSEDEVVARSFAIIYRRTKDSQPKTLELQYMKNDQGVYELRPPPPSQLP